MVAASPILPGSTAARVLAALERFGLKREGDGRYRCNSPLRPTSDSHAFTLVIDDAEHGAWHDHVSGQRGSLYQLAEALGIPRSSRRLVRAYDYVDEHGALLYRTCRFEPGKGGRAKDFQQRRPDGNGGWIYDLDLADDHWRAIEIDARGWRVIESADCPVYFRRVKGQLPLPEPERGGSLHELRALPPPGRG